MESTAERRPDPDRIAGLSVTISLHILVAMALLMAAGPHLLTERAPQPRGIEAELIPNRPEVPEPPPPPPQEVQQAATAPQPIARPAPTAPPVPTEAASPMSYQIEQVAVDPTLPLGDGAVTEGEPTDFAAGGGGGRTLAYVHAPAPPYPIEQLRRGIQGTVWLLVDVDAHGRPLQVRVDRSSGNRQLDNAARQQVLRHWRFQPAIRNGQAVPASGLVPISFRLD